MNKQIIFFLFLTRSFASALSFPTVSNFCEITITIYILSKAKEEFDVYMKSLMTIYNRELVDSAAQEFLLTLNTPVNRKRLPREIWKVDRRRIDLLPFFTRLAASLKECAPKIADDLASYLLKEMVNYCRATVVSRLTKRSEKECVLNSSSFFNYKDSHLFSIIHSFEIFSSNCK